MPLRIPPKHFYCLVFGATALFFVIAIYWSGLYGGFFFDDEANIHQNPGVRLNDLSLAAIREATTGGISGPSGRPISQLSFGFSYFLSGFNPFSFKLTNLVIHCLNGILVFFLTLQLSRKTSTDGRPLNASLFAGIIAFAWLVHPIQLTSVLYVVQRMTSLSAFFLLAALLVHVLSRNRSGRGSIPGLLIAWGILWPLSYFSKETGILFPLFALAWEIFLRRSEHQKFDRFATIFLTAAALALVASSAYMLSPAGNWLWAGYELRNFSLIERLLTEGRVLCFYIGLILFPRLDALGLYHDDFSISTGLLTPWTTLPALLLLAGLTAIAWRVKNSRPLIAFGIAWFFIGHLLESTVLPLEIAHEHRNYLPLLGLLIAGGDLIARPVENKGTSKTICIALVAAALLYLPLVTALRAHQFGDSARLALIEAERHPGSSASQYEAGRILSGLAESASQGLPFYPVARKHYEQATLLDPNSKKPLLGLIHLACKTGQPLETRWIEELEHRLRTPPFAPGDRNVLFSLKEMSIAGTICLPRQGVDRLFAAALANPVVSPGIQAILHSWHADYLWLSERDMAAARNALERSLALNPANASNRLKWAQLIFIAGERKEAQQLLLKLRHENFSADEQKTLNELLATYNIAGH
jgi:hypothetical protein